MSKITQAMNYEITFDKEIYRVLDNIGYAVWRVRTKSTTMAYDWQQFKFSYKERLDKYPKEKELLGRTLLADIVRETKDLALIVGSTIVDTASQTAVKRFMDLGEEINKGNIHIPTYRRDGSFPMKAQAINDLVKNNFN